MRITMTISPTMNLDHLAERMSTTDVIDINSAARMRHLLVKGASFHGWETTGEIDEDSWLTMLEEATE
jgi:hypothetical protein